MLEKTILANHHQNVIQFNKIQKNFIQINVLFWKKNIFNCVCHWKYFKNQLNFFSIWTSINKIWNIEIDVCAMFKVKYGLNRMHSTIFAHQVGWFDDKGVDIHPYGLRIKLHNLHSCGEQWYVDHMYLT